MLKTVLVALMLTLIFVLAISAKAEAKHRRAAEVMNYSHSAVRVGHERSWSPRRHTHVARYKHRRLHVDPNGNSATRIVEHPSGCPRRAFCGCAVSLRVFGKAVTRGGLAIAANWLAFPRTQPAPGMVAAKRGHVKYILSVNSNGTVVAYDPNSGGHKTRIHTVSLRGYTVVDPYSRTVGL